MGAASDVPENTVPAPSGDPASASAAASERGDPGKLRPESRSPGRAHTWAIAGLIVAVGLFGLVTWAVLTEGAWVARIDAGLTEWTRSWADDWGWPVDVAVVIGVLAGPALATAYAVVVVLALARAQRRAAAGLLALSSLVGVALAEGLKRSVARERPPGAEVYEPGVLRSFPSGHSMAGIYLYLLSGVLLLLLGQALGRRALVVVGWVLVVCGPLIGASRLVLGVHWPSDIVAGWALGAAVALACSLLLWRPVAAGWTPPRGSA